MKNFNTKIVAGALILSTILACQKSERAEDTAEMSKTSSTTDDAAEAVTDSVSYAANQQIADKKFVKTADVNMEVKDVYNATIFIEKQLKDLGGFVTVSRLNSNVLSEETFETSDSEATLVKKFQTENKMQARVPSDKLGDFLTFINDKKIFLNSRVILAEDVTNNAKIAALETKKLQQTGQVIDKMKNNGEKVEKTESNLIQNNDQQIQKMKLADDLKYSTVDIYIKEPQIRVAEIAVMNSKNIDNKYKFNFFYDLKNALVEGFYMIQKIIIGLATIWPFLLIAGLIFYFLRKRKTFPKLRKPEVTE
jgi:hypothetical protein